jgi:CheY-like chemotaxis protein
MRVLVCDDNVDAAATLGMLIRSRRHDVFLCHDGKTCIAKARDWRPEIAILDIGMPEMNGYEVAAELRALEFGKDMLIIAVTGYNLPEYGRVAREAGFDLFLAKPADLERLFGAVDGRESKSA